ncbi:MAG TPA: hypothetical protein VKR79_09555 [Gaiellaceae bacterium]|nr:hypothetical protein [Gaiellaceae bacterium]
MSASGNATGSWSETEKDSVDASGTGCTFVPSSFTVDSSGPFSGSVSGAVVSVLLTGSATFTPSTITETCSGVSNPVTFTSPESISESGDFPLAELVANGSGTAPQLFGTQTLTLTKQPVPPPQQGKSVDAKPVQGTVLVNGVPLTSATQIPTGAVIDTTRGVIAITTAVGKQTDQATFASGLFRLTQAKATGLTTAALVREKTSVCRVLGASSSTGAHAKPPLKTVLDRLVTNGHGKFRSRGKYAAGAAHGTRWLLEDRCDGTFIQVYSDVVTVYDYVLHKTILVRAGQSYLARPG